MSRVARSEAARWIASRQGKAGAYAGMFAPTKKDFEQGIRVFTGERIATRAGTAHILGEEGCRVLILLKAGGKEAREALARATEGMLGRLRHPYRTEAAKRSRVWGQAGVYCCGICSVAYWRHLAVGGLDHQEGRLRSGLKVLKAMRDGKGKWRVFPFFYTLLALSEMDNAGAVREMRYAAAVCQRYLSRRRAEDNVYTQRKRLLAERILSRC